MQKLIYRNSIGQEVILGNSRPFLLEKLESGANISTSINTLTGVGQDGVSVTNVAIKEKVLPITGAIRGVSTVDIDTKREYLSSVLNPKFQGELIYTNNAITRTVKGRIQSLDFQDKVGLMQKFLIQFLCPSPFWIDVFEKKEEVALWVGDFEFDLEILDKGIELGHRESNLIVNVLNSGNVDCGMRIEFIALATVVNPSLLNVYTKKYIKVKRTLNAGDKLVIDTNFGNKKVEMIKNGVRTNVFNYIDLNSTFLQLSVGDNLLRYDAESGIDNLEVAVYYKPLYIGI